MQARRGAHGDLARISMVARAAKHFSNAANANHARQPSNVDSNAGNVGLFLRFSRGRLGVALVKVCPRASRRAGGGRARPGTAGFSGCSVRPKSGAKRFRISRNSQLQRGTGRGRPEGRDAASSPVPSTAGAPPPEPRRLRSPQRSRQGDALQRLLSKLTPVRRPC